MDGLHNGLKPEIIFSDSLNNDIELIRNEEYCLKYNRPIHTHGLLWTELIDWWKEDQKKISWTNSEAGDSLYQRLKESLNNNNNPNPVEIRLLPKSKRVVIEIDGKQHYSNQSTGIADFKLYAEMVAEDRRLKLLGYEVFRFGGYEMMQNNYETLIEDFFIKLFDTNHVYHHDEQFSYIIQKT